MNGDTKDRVIVPGQPGPLMHEVLGGDKRPVEVGLLGDRNDYFDSDLGPKRIGKERYISREFYEREVDMVWGRAWQMACREEQVPNVGDYQLYEIADKSIIVTRTAPDTIKAYYNSCPHRGRTLCDDPSGRVANFRCKFHGMIWKLDGSLGHIPARWDFPHVENETFCLPEVKVARWQGFVFINMDPDCIPFEDYIQDLDQYVGGYDYENRFLAVNVGLVIGCNWKVALEAFLEDYHVLATHSQVLPFINAQSTMYSVWADKPHWSRMLFALGVKSPYVADTTSEEQTFERMKIQNARPGEVWEYQPGRSARDQIVDIMRARYSAMGMDVDNLPDSDVLDGWLYHIFPNAMMFGGIIAQMFTWRPYDNDPNKCVMDINLLLPLPEGAPRPPAAEYHLYPENALFSEIKELEAGSFLDQDLGNMAWVQKGLHSMSDRGAVLARYQESMILHFNRVLDMYLNGERPLKDGASA